MMFTSDNNMVEFEFSLEYLRKNKKESPYSIFDCKVDVYNRVNYDNKEWFENKYGETI